MNILVIDGQGGRLGRKLVENIRRICPDATITAVGTNSAATQSMMGAAACRTANIIVGALGIATADAMMGEISPAMANAVASSAAYRVLIPMNLCGTYIAGVMQGSAAIIDDAMEHIRQLVDKGMIK